MVVSLSDAFYGVVVLFVMLDINVWLKQMNIVALIPNVYVANILPYFNKTHYI